MQLEGKAALVTGGGRGIGRAIALAYASEGADVAVAARTLEELEEVAGKVRSMGRRGLAITADLTDSRDALNAVERTIEDLGKIDILVNNIGGYRLFTPQTDAAARGYRPGGGLPGYAEPRDDDGRGSQRPGLRP